MVFDRETAVPGFDYRLGTEAGGQFALDPRLDRNLHRLQLYSALLAGGDRILYPPAGTRHPVTGGALPDGSYLTRLPAESSLTPRNGALVDVFHERVRRSAHEPIAEQVIGIYVNWLFRQAIDRQPVIDALGETIMADVDLRGHSAAQFLERVYTLGLTLGSVAVLTDLPRPTLEPSASRAHELALGIRPYCRIIPPQRIWQWERDEVTGEFIWALIHERRGRWRLWTVESTTTIIRSQGKEAEYLVEEHDLGRVPLDLFVAKEPDENDEYAHLGESAIASSALLQLQLDQHSSLTDDLLRKTNFPFLHVQDEPIAASSMAEVDSDETVGADFIFTHPGNVSWLAPSPSCAQEGRANMARLESAIYKVQGVHRRSQDSVEAHSGLALDYETSPIYATVQAWAERLRIFELRLWQTVGQLSGREVPAEGVAYPQDFTTRPIDLDIAQAKAVTDVFGGYSVMPKWAQRCVEVKIHRGFRRDLGHLSVAKELLDGALVVKEDDVIVDPLHAFTGPQITGLLEIIHQAALGEIPRDTAVESLIVSLSLERPVAEKILGTIGRGFRPKELDSVVE